MNAHESHLQEDGSTFPPVTPDVPHPPGVAIPEVPDPFAEPRAEDEAGDVAVEGSGEGSEP